VERAPERVEVFAPEDLGEGADGEEKAGRRGDPARAVGGEGAPRDDAVEVEVLRQILPPGVQDGRDPEVAAEMAGIAAEGGEGVGGGVEEEGVEEPGLPWARALRVCGRVKTRWKYSTGNSSVSVFRR
jgi:hypothetical protein